MRVAILTNFDHFRSGYSLTGIVLNQWRMLSAYGHKVDVYVNQDCEYDVHNLPPGEIRPVMPKGNLIDYGVDKKFPSVDSMTPEHIELTQETARILDHYLGKDTDVACTHDWIFTGWNLPYAEAVKTVDEKIPVSWLHWVHSMPLFPMDWHCQGRYGNNHKIVFPTTINRQLVADQFMADWDDVRIIPHIQDPRVLFRLTDATREFIDAHKHIMQADICQVYPVGTDRLNHKGMRELVLLFAQMKRMKRRICLVVANSWATGRMAKQPIDIYKRLVVRNGLRWGKDVIFTSEFKPPKYEIGIPHDMVADLFRFSNLFVFPTVVESFGLVLTEALMSGGILSVCNRNVDSMFEVAGGTGLYAEFPSYRTEDELTYGGTEREYFEKLAKQIVARLEQEDGILGKTRAIQRYNWDNIYHRYYEPLLAEATMWV